MPFGRKHDPSPGSTIDDVGLRKKKGCLGLVLFSSVMCSLISGLVKAEVAVVETHAKLRPIHTTLPACFSVEAWGARLAIVRLRANMAVIEM